MDREATQPNFIYKPELILKLHLLSTRRYTPYMLQKEFTDYCRHRIKNVSYELHKSI